MDSEPNLPAVKPAAVVNSPGGRQALLSGSKSVLDSDEAHLPARPKSSDVASSLPLQRPMPRTGAEASAFAQPLPDRTPNVAPRRERSAQAQEDLPAVLESDLPAALRPKALLTADEDLPATRDSELPAVFSPGKPSRGAGVDVPKATPEPRPAVRDGNPWGSVPDDAGEFILPNVKGMRPAGDASRATLELASTSVVPPPQSIKSTPPDLDNFEFDLPSPLQAHKGFPELDAASERRRGTQPGGFDFPDLVPGLPATAQSGIGLPSVPGRSDGTKKTLAGPSSVPPADSPDPSALDAQQSSVLEIDLGLEFAQAAKDGGARFERTASSQGRPGVDAASLPPALGAAGAAHSQAAFEVNLGEIELPIVPSSFPPKRQPFSSQPPLEDDGVSEYGQVSLESSGQDLPVETEDDVVRHSVSGEVLEFGAVPQADPRALLPDGPAPPAPSTIEATDARSNARSAKAGARENARVPGSKRSRVVALAGIVCFVVAGSTLTLAPDVGPFGWHFLIDQLRRKDDDALLHKHIEAARQVLAADDFSGVTKVLAGLETAGRERERFRLLKAYAAYFTYVIELRHGSQPQSRARAKVILDELGDKYELKYLGIANAARAAAEGNVAKARRAIATEVSKDPRSTDAQAVSAEISMLERRPAEALQTWQLIAKLEPSARASYGAARAHFDLGQLEAAAAEGEQAIHRNPTHVGARLLLARVAIERHGDLEGAERRIGEAIALQTQQSTADFVQAKTLTGDLQLRRSRISLAEAAYQEALERDPRSAAALRGLGETLYRAGRYSESLARYEAGLQADPDDVQVAVGVAKAQLALERVREAGALLSRLRQANPKHYAVNYWYAKAEEAAGNRDEAEKAYAAAIEVGGTNPVVVDAYVSMALLKNQQGRREEAQKVLSTAQEKLPRMPKIHEAIGQLALSEGRYAGAVEEFRKALALDPNDLGTKFRLGVALRKNRNFDAAAKVFDEIAVVDRDYPGLALERGQLYEASGQTEEALRAFESALTKAPTDPDLMLRVGCGKVAAGRSQQAEQLLKKVLEQRPTSAETHHCLGRAQLFDGSNLALALRTLERAVELDPHRAEYHLYVGWAANEAGRVALAEQALRKALELDQGLGDAYWQRGILRYRQGAVRDAVTDLTRALELRPGRYEAHAALADAYFDLGFEPKALEQWRVATIAQPDNATWRFRYGKLLQAAHRDAEAKPELEAALELAAKQAVTPRWAWEAHHLLARAIGAQPPAVKHWQAFLELAPRDNAYRDEAKQALAKLGQPWDRD